jgi:hypothetical protein
MKPVLLCVVMNLVRSSTYSTSRFGSRQVCEIFFGMVMDDESPQKPWICAHTCDDAFCSSNRSLLDYLFPVILFFTPLSSCSSLACRLGLFFSFCYVAVERWWAASEEMVGPQRVWDGATRLAHAGGLPPSRVCYFGKQEPPMPKMDRPSNGTKIRPAMH